MTVQNINARWLLFLGGLLLCTAAVVAINSYGEVVQIIPGNIQRCEHLGGGDKSLPHATIKTESGRYVITRFKGCAAGTDVKVLVKRSVFYFNTIYTAEAR